jgi:4'-phosphopantetheinyl transferase
MIDVEWIEQTEADVPRETEWLSANEARQLNDMRFPKRRDDWRLGRWTAKQALALYLDIPDDFQSLAHIEIRPAASGAPKVFLNNAPAGVSISLSHRSGRAVCAVTQSEVALGCDLEKIEPRSDAFVRDYFTADEQKIIAGSLPADRSRLAALLWSGKESALKALQTGLRLDTRCAVVGLSDLSFGPHHWHPLEVCCVNCLFLGWWQHANGFLRTMVSAPQANPPICRLIPSLSGRSAVQVT